MITPRQQRQLSNQIDGTSVGLAVLVGAAISLGLIELLASPLAQIANVNVQILAVQTTLLASPLLISLLLLLRDGGVLVSQGAMLAGRHPRWLRRLWLVQVLPLVLTSLVLALYLLAAAMVCATLTQPDLNNIRELATLLGSLEPIAFGLALLKTVVFAAVCLWICLQQGASCQLQGLRPLAALSRAISLTLAVLLSLDLALVLAFDPLLIQQ